MSSPSVSCEADRGFGPELRAELPAHGTLPQVPGFELTDSLTPEGIRFVGRFRKNSPGKRESDAGAIPFSTRENIE